MMLYKWEFLDAAIRSDDVGPFTVATVKTGASRWETRVYDGGTSGPIDSAVTHCAALVDEQHDDMVAGFFDFCVDNDLLDY